MSTCVMKITDRLYVAYIKNSLYCEVVLDESLATGLDDECRRPDEGHVVFVVVNVQILNNLLLVRQHHSCHVTVQFSQRYCTYSLSVPIGKLLNASK